MELIPPFFHHSTHPIHVMPREASTWSRSWAVTDLSLV